MMVMGCETQAVALKYGLSAFNTENIYGVLPDGIRKIDVTDDTAFTTSSRSTTTSTCSRRSARRSATAPPPASSCASA